MSDPEKLSILNRPPEDDEGVIEYKLHLCDLTETQKLHRISQLQYRLEGGSDSGQAIYIIGLTDDGFPVGITREQMNQSIDNLKKIVENVTDAKVCSIEETEVIHYAESEEKLIEQIITNPRFTHQLKQQSNSRADVQTKWKIMRENQEKGYPEHKRYISEVIIRKRIGDYWEIKVGIAGNVDCGKSTLLGVLASGKNDDGRGAARLTVMKHKHEADSGRTSSVGQEIVGFDDHGNSVNAQLAVFSHGAKVEWRDIVTKSSKIVTFFDLAGHLDYLSQTVRGLSSNQLDYVLVIIGANMSDSVDATAGAVGMAKVKDKWINMTKEHMSIVLALGIQCIVVVTKIDSTPEPVTKETIRRVTKMIKSKFNCYSVDSLDEVYSCVRLMESGNTIPLIKVSNVTLEGHDILRKLLNMLPPCREYVNSSPPVLQIQEIFKEVPGIALVVAGMLTTGEVFAPEGKKICRIKIGPMSDGRFLETRVRSIHCKRMDVTRARSGCYVCLGLPKNDEVNPLIKKGMFAIGAEMKNESSWEFWLYAKLAKEKSSCVKVGYTPYCHIGHINQTCKVLAICEWNPKWTGPSDIGEFFLPPDQEQVEHDPDNPNKVTIKHPDFKQIDLLKAGDHALILMRFCFKPELILERDIHGTTKLMFREQKIKGMGEILCPTDTTYKPLDNQEVTKSQKTRPSRKQRKLLAAGALGERLPSKKITGRPVNKL